MADLQSDKLISRKEIVIPITLKGLWNGLERIFLKAPLNIFKFGMRKADSASQRGMTGRFAAVTMPLSIMLRNGSRVAHGAANQEGGFWSRSSVIVLGATGAGMGWFAGFTALNNLVLAKFAVAGGVAKVGVGIGAAVLSFPAVLPAISTGILVGAAAMGVLALTASVVPAVVNLGVAFNRSRDAFKGVEYNEKNLQDALAKDGLQRAYDSRRDSATLNAFWRMPEDKQRLAYDELSQRFAEAAAREQKAAVAAPAAAPAAQPRARR